MTKKNLIVQDPIGDGVGARKLKVRLSLSRIGHVAEKPMEFYYLDELIYITLHLAGFLHPVIF